MCKTSQVSYHKILHVFLQTSICLFQRRLQGAHHNLSSSTRAQLQLPSSFLPCLLHSPFKTQNASYILLLSNGNLHFSFFVANERQSKICLCKPYSHNCHVHFWGHAQHPIQSENLNAKENRLASASLCSLSPHLPSHGRRKEA